MLGHIARQPSSRARALRIQDATGRACGRQGDHRLAPVACEGGGLVVGGGVGLLCIVYSFAPDDRFGAELCEGGKANFEIASESYQQAWEEAFTWIVQNGHECDDKPCYELYYNDPSKDPEGKSVFDICIPLKSA